MKREDCSIECYNERRKKWKRDYIKWEWREKTAVLNVIMREEKSEKKRLYKVRVKREDCSIECYNERRKKWKRDYIKWEWREKTAVLNVIMREEKSEKKRLYKV